MTVLPVAVAAAFGALAGACGRLLIARLRRGAVVRAGPCEGAGAALCAMVILRWTQGLPDWWVPVPLALTVIAVPLAVVDLRHRRLPDALTYAAYWLLGAALLVAAGTGGGGAVVVGGLFGAGVFTAGHLLVHRCVPSSLGAGDVKLAGSLGAVLGAVGWQALAVAAGLASVFTLLLATGAALTRRTDWRSGVPHGPAMLAATWLVTVFPGTGSGVA